MKKDSPNKVDDNLKLIAKSSIIVFAGIILSKIFLYVYRMIIGRYYGPEIYGLFSLSLIILTLLVAISSLGLSEGLVRYISLYLGEKQKNKIIYSVKISILISFISSVITGIFLFFLSDFISINFFHDFRLSIFLKISSFIIPLYTLSNVFLSIIRAFEKISWYSFIINILQNIIKLIVLIFFIFLGFKADTLMISFLLGIFVMLIVAYLVCRHYISLVFERYILNGKEKKGILQAIFNYSIPLMFSSVTFIIYSGIDSFVLAFFRGTYDVGIYNAAIPLVALMGLIPDLFIQLFYPLVTKEFAKKNFELIKELSKQISKWIFMLVLPIFLIIFIFPEIIISLLFGEQYISAANSLRILSIGGFIFTFQGLLTVLLSMAGKSKILLINFLITLLLNLILNILFIPKYGLIGAAISTSFVWMIFTFILFIEIKKIVHFIPLKRAIGKILVISLIPASLLFILKMLIRMNLFSTLVLIIFFVLSYLILMYITGCFDKKDLMILRSIKRKLIGG